MQGKVIGLGVRIQSKIAPYAQVLHCMSHRTNLAYKTISDFPLVGKVELLLKKAYKFFSSSPKRMSSFKSFAEGITDGNMLLKDVSTRWISLNGPVRRLCEEYVSVAGAVYEFKGSSDPDTSVMALELYGLLTDGEILFTLFALQPLLARLNYLIKLSQDSDIFIPEYSMARTMVQNEVENMYVDNVDAGKSWYECGKKGLFDMWKKLVAIGTDKSFLKYNRHGVLRIHVKGKFMNLKVSKESGRGGHKRRVDFQSSDFESIMNNVKGNMKQIACKLANELRCRFPPDELLEAIGIVFPHFWNHVHSEQSCSIAFQAKFKIIKKYFCCTKVVDGVTIKGLLDFEQLKVQAFMFGETMYQQFLELEDPLKFGAATRLWRKLASNTVLRAAISEYFKLADLCLCMILGSVKDERCFSTLSFIKNKLRNRFEGNLDATLRLYECNYKMEDFPYDTAFQIWNDSRKRRGSSKLHAGDVDASHAVVVEGGVKQTNRTVRLWSLDNIDEESVQPD